MPFSLSLCVCLCVWDFALQSNVRWSAHVYVLYYSKAFFLFIHSNLLCVYFFSSFSILMNRKVKVYLRCHRRQYNFFFDLWLNMHMRFTLHFSVFFFDFKRVIFHILIINFQFWKNFISLQRMCSECVYDVELVLNCWHCTSICAGHKQFEHKMFRFPNQNRPINKINKQTSFSPFFVSVCMRIPVPKIKDQQKRKKTISL